MEQLREKMRQWYPLPREGSTPYYLQEWLRHGSCYLANMIEDNPRVYGLDPLQFNRTIFSEYFRSGVEKAAQLDLTLNRGQAFHSKEEFARRIGFEGKEDHFNLICGDDNEVD